MQDRDALLTAVQVAELLHLAVGTLANWRTRGGGPPYARIGGRALYRRGDVEDWIDLQTRASTSDPGPGPTGRTAPLGGSGVEYR